LHGKLKKFLNGLPLRQNIPARNSFSPAEPPVDDPGQPARLGKVKEGTRPALPAGAGAFTLTIRAVSKSFDGQRSGGKDLQRDIQPVSPVVSPEGARGPFLKLAGVGAAGKVLRQVSGFVCREAGFDAVGVVRSFRAWFTGLDRGKRRQNLYFPAFLQKSARWCFQGPDGVI